MGVHIVTQSLTLLLIATTTSQFMPPSSFPYPFQHGQPPMQVMHMPNGPPMMQMPNGPHMMQMPNGGPMMPLMPRLPGGPPGAMPMPMPMPFPMNGGRMPMVVMPHSKKSNKARRRRRKPRRKRINIGSSSSEASCSESVEYRRSRSKSKSLSKSATRQVLTPVISYVTKEGYVVYQKKIKKDRARDWLEMTKGDEPHNSQEFKEKIRINH